MTDLRSLALAALEDAYGDDWRTAIPPVASWADIVQETPYGLLARILALLDRLRYARAVATIWRDAYMENHRNRTGEVQWGIGTHPLALVLAALDGETDPAQLGCDADALLAALARLEEGK